MDSNTQDPFDDRELRNFQVDAESILSLCDYYLNLMSSNNNPPTSAPVIYIAPSSIFQDPNSGASNAMIDTANATNPSWEADDLVPADLIPSSPEDEPTPPPPPVTKAAVKKVPKPKPSKKRAKGAAIPPRFTKNTRSNSKRSAEQGEYLTLNTHLMSLINQICVLAKEGTSASMMDVDPPKSLGTPQTIEAPQHAIAVTIREASEESYEEFMQETCLTAEETYNAYPNVRSYNPSSYLKTSLTAL